MILFLCIRPQNGGGSKLEVNMGGLERLLPKPAISGKVGGALLLYKLLNLLTTRWW